MTEQREAFDVAACTCASLRKATRAVTQAYDAALRPAGLKATQFTTLAALARRGDAPLTQLAESLVMDRTTLTRNLKPLVRRDFIRIDPAADQRVRTVSLTADGRRVFEAALPGWRQAQARMVEGLGEARWSGLVQDLGAAVTVVRD